MQNENILVTGAAGFIGSHLCEHLLMQGYKVIGIDNFDSFYPRSYKERNLQQLRLQPSFLFIEGDAGDIQILNSIEQKIDAVVHLAAKAGVQPSLNQPQEYIQANIKVTNQLLEWMKDLEIKKFVFASSSSVYGNTHQVPFSENQLTNRPFSPYAFTKSACELMNYTYHSLYEMDIVNLRFFTVYGERQRPDLAIHKFVKKVFDGEVITVYGIGDTSRDYTYYADTIQGVMSALKYVLSNKGVYDTFNLGNNEPVALNDLLAAIGEATGKKLLLQYSDKMPGDVDITFANIDHARKILNYQPKTTLKEGLSRFVKWYMQNVIEEHKTYINE